MNYELGEEMNSVCNMGEAIRRKAEKKGENQMSALITKLKELNRIDDAFRAAADEQYRDKLFKELQITHA